MVENITRGLVNIILINMANAFKQTYYASLYIVHQFLLFCNCRIKFVRNFREHEFLKSECP